MSGVRGLECNVLFVYAQTTLKALKISDRKTITIVIFFKKIGKKKDNKKGREILYHHPQIFMVMIGLKIDYELFSL